MIVRRLVERDREDLLAVAARSALPSLERPEHVERLLAHHVAFGAFHGGRLVGCAAVELNVRKAYWTLQGGRDWFPLPNAYLCGAFVVPECRGLGLGLELYRRRLAWVRRNCRGTAVIELLGSGLPYSVDTGARAGDTFYRHAGFRTAGFSADADAGPVAFLTLVRPATRPASTTRSQPVYAEVGRR